MLISYSPQQAEALSSLPCLFQQPPWKNCRGVVHWEGGLPRAAALFPFVPFQKRTALCLFGEEGAHFAPLIAAALEQASGLGLRLVTTDLSYGSHPFAEKGGLVPWFTIRHMVYEGEPLPGPLSPIPYEDPWYRAYQDLIAQAFLPLRRAMDVPPHRILPSVEDRLFCAQHRRDIFLFLKNRQLMGAVSLDGSGLLDNLAVSPAFQGQGLGKGILAFAVNRLLAQGQTPTLEVLDWNEKAIRLYESQGFVTRSRRSLYRRDLPPKN